MNRQRTIAFALAALQMGILATTPAAWGQDSSEANPTSQRQAQEPEWSREQPDGSILTRAGLDEILRRHTRWFWSETDQKEGERAELRRANLTNANLIEANLTKAILTAADLTNADLEHADLIKAHLSRAILADAILWDADLTEASLHHANLTGADLANAILTEAILYRANLTEAILDGANLVGAELNEADLTKAMLWKANLTEAILYKANLTEADLEDARLIGAKLRETNLSGARLAGADLEGAVFEPKPNSLPYIPDLTSAKNLDKLRYEYSEAGLVELRTALKNAGLRRQEREVNYALLKCRRQKMQADPHGWGDRLDAPFNYVLFEITCKYGMEPGMPLAIMGVGVLAFAVPYFLVLWRRERSSRADIWLEVEDESIRPNRKRKRRMRLLASAWVVPSSPARVKGQARAKPRARGRRLQRTLLAALYFSLLTAFRVGFREINVGNWISRMQCREYTLRATGWVRFVTGLQSLISVYLLALWLATYFGRPFE